MAEQDLDRNEAATQYKLSEARKRGQVSKSPDVISAIVFAVAVVYVNWQGWENFRDQFRFDQALLNLAGRVDASPAVLWQLISHGLASSLTLLAPFFATIMLAAIVGNLIQIGPVFSTKPLGPDWDKVNPANGFKRLFSLRTLFDGAKACLKLTLLVWVVYRALKSLAPQFFNLAGYSPQGYIRTLLGDMTSIGMKLILMMGLIAICDWLYTRHEFAKKMRMSRRDLRDESKHRDGDPRIRARLRELRNEMLKRSLALGKTGDADVLITNPTHLAVALRYTHGEMSSPQMVSKGAGLIAAAMRKIAAEKRIPVVQNRTLARKLFHEVGVDQQVPPALYADVARIIVWVFAMRQARESGGRPVQAAAGGKT
ncbi:flagellar biosynthesis protein FlhB [Collimonas humicola]|uniref:EscU/YscU/HrcU family type III secretion system export apparatus switch protein n=1 Tax=Collimonas humicola TaxID=2825886 RepID=UPI001B8D3D08|nr:EscU/YscU/HrcU family type III secretion system export apparatus switch protein [Collimonas humicola]